MKKLKGAVALVIIGAALWVIAVESGAVADFKRGMADRRAKGSAPP